ncbi:MAG: MBL fold metallo-hydrolase [Candidatus Limnocylindrales bacterium]
MEIQTFVTLGLGDNSFLVGSGDEAVLVDPQRDAWRFTEHAERRGWRIRHVLETHVHNDYVSGALEVRASTGAQIVVAAGSGPFGFDHRLIEPGDEIRIGDIRLVPRAAPGHTFQHIAWELWIPDSASAPAAVFTGGSLLVGSVGRTDLLGEQSADELARAQYRTVRELALLPDAVQILPTHGAGSFCVASVPSAQRTSTIGEERQGNAGLNARDEDSFVREQTGALGRYPAYYPRMAPINRAGPASLGHVPLISQLDVGAVERAAAAGAWIVDGRDRTAFADAHIPGSINIELNESFASYVGWTIPFDAPIVLILPEPISETGPEAAVQLFRIGRGGVAGQLAGGIDAWTAANRAIRAYPTASMKDLFQTVRRGDSVAVLDVRQPAEWRDDGVLPGCRTIFVADLLARMAELPRDQELWVVCSSGHRAAIATSLLDRDDIPVRLVARGGPIGWVERFDRLAAIAAIAASPAIGA